MEYLWIWLFIIEMEVVINVVYDDLLIVNGVDIFMDILGVGYFFFLYYFCE